MQEIFNKYNIELTSEELDKFNKFLDLFIEKNSQINLSAIRDRDEIIEKHLIDSIMIKVFEDISGDIIDLGTGGGFPGIPLAIVDTESNYTLVDSVGKKIKVVDEFIDYLGLKNVKTINSRFEDLGRDKIHRDRYDYVVSRATRYLPVLIEYAIPLLQVGGVLIAYKLDETEEIDNIDKVLNSLNSKLIDIEKYEIGGQKRAFIFIQKIGPTPKKYPRKTGEAKSNPII